MGLESGFAADSLVTLNRICCIRHLVHMASLSRLGSRGLDFGLLVVADYWDVHGCFDFSAATKESMTKEMPNKSPEPTAVGAAVAIHAASRRWLSFGR